MRFFFLILILIVMFPKPVCADILKFGILADTRCGELPSSGWNETGVNTSAVNAIARDMVNENVNFVLAGGDLIHGQFIPFDYIPLSNMYKAWTNAMGPVQNANIPIFPVPGNHEYYYGTFQVHTNVSAAGPVPMTAWSNIFEDLPKNGPDGKVGRTYSFSFSNVFLMGD